MKILESGCLFFFINFAVNKSAFIFRKYFFWKMCKVFFGRFKMSPGIGIICADCRINKICLMTFCKFFSYRIIGIDFISFFYKIGGNWFSSFWQRFYCRIIKISKHCKGQRLWNRGGAHHQKMWFTCHAVFFRNTSLCNNCLTLKNSKTVLFINYRKL